MSSIERIPCKNCITKPICRNELYERLLKHKERINKFLIGPSMFVLRQKCSTIDKVIDQAGTNAKCYSIMRCIYKDLGLLKIEGISERIDYLIRIHITNEKFEKSPL